MASGGDKGAATGARVGEFSIKAVEWASARVWAQPQWKDLQKGSFRRSFTIHPSEG